MSPHREDKGESLQEGRKGKVCSGETQRDRKTGGGGIGKAPQRDSVTGLK